MSEEKMEVVEVTDGKATISITTQKQYSKEEIQGEINSLEASKKSFQDQIDLYQAQINDCDAKIKEWSGFFEVLGGE